MDKDNDGRFFDNSLVEVFRVTGRKSWLAAGHGHGCRARF